MGFSNPLLRFDVWTSAVASDVVSGDESAYQEIAKFLPIGPARRSEEIAAVLWLCSPAASYTVGPSDHGGWWPDRGASLLDSGGSRIIRADKEL